MITGISLRAAELSAALVGLALLGATAPAQAGAQENGATITVTGFRAPNMFGTVALSVSLSRYAADWQRAKRDAAAVPAMQRLIAPARAFKSEQQVAYIQSAVQRQIRWMSDATAWGHHEYWASAAETLSLGSGDAEDRAIVKMQALRALGFRPNDLILTIGRDKVWGRMTILIVRIDGGRQLTLDDLSGPPVPIERREGFEPIMSFSAERSWLHGHRKASPMEVAQVGQ